jgi:hypothetical protein
MEQKNIEKRNTKNNTFIQINQCSLASLRGKPPPEQSSITIILKKIFLMPPTLIYTNCIFYKKFKRKIFLEVKDSIRSSYIDLFTFIQ